MAKQYQVSFGIFVLSGEETLRQYKCEASSEAEARTLAIQALHRGKQGGIFAGPQAARLEEVPPQGTLFPDVSGIDLRKNPKFCINVVRVV